MSTHFETKLHEYFIFKNSTVHNSKSKFCTEIFNFKNHSKIGWEICVPVSWCLKMRMCVEKEEMLRWNQSIISYYLGHYTSSRLTPYISASTLPPNRIPTCYHHRRSADDPGLCSSATAMSKLFCVTMYWSMVLCQRLMYMTMVSRPASKRYSLIMGYSHHQFCSLWGILP